MALAFKRLADITCNSCGTRPDEWYGPDGKPIHPAPYRADTRKCPGCEATEAMRESVPESEAGVYVVLLRQPPPIDDDEPHGVID